MAKVVKYRMRGEVGGQSYKMVRGRIRRMHEVRGEDEFVSKFDAIWHFAQALRAMATIPDGISYDITSREVEET